jgi:hypothetical protein
MQNQGIRFVGRYYSATTQIPGKRLTQSEAALLSKAGLWIVTAYEDDPVNYAYFSAARGVSDAKAAIGYATAVGQPANTPIYFTVDYDPSAADVAGNITEYFSAVAETLAGSYSMGVYGSGLVCASITGANLAKYSWLCGSTSFQGSQYSEWSIKQGPVQTMTTDQQSVEFDTDVAQGDYGGFVVSATN